MVRRLIPGLGLCAAVAAPFAWGGVFDDPKNLKVLPEDISPQQLRETMRGFAFDLGLRCEDCHVGEAGRPLDTFDFAADDKELKHAARLMLRMTAEINGRHLAGLDRTPAKRIEVRCFTCHRGLPKPVPIGDELAAAYGRGGVPAAAARYRELKGEFFGSASYDFTETPRLQFADRLAAAKDVAGAIDFLRQLHDEHGASFWTDLKLGELHFANEEMGEAVASFEAARDAAPPALRESIQKRLDGLAPERRGGG